MKLKILIILCCSLLVAEMVFARTKNINIDVGGTKIGIQAPAQFHEVSSQFPLVRKLAGTFTPPANRLLGVFLSEDDLGMLMLGKTPKFNRYILLQVNRNAEKKNISNFQFQQVSKELARLFGRPPTNKFKSYVDGMFEDASESLSNELEIAIKMKLDSTVQLGKFLEMPNAVGFASLTKNTVTVEGVNVVKVLAATTSIIRINGKLFSAYVYSNFETQNDLNWVRSKTREWLGSLHN